MSMYFTGTEQLWFYTLSKVTVVSYMYNPNAPLSNTTDINATLVCSTRAGIGCTMHTRTI